MRFVFLLMVLLGLSMTPAPSSFAETVSLNALKQAAFEQGPEEQFRLGLAYYKGEIVPRDYVNAYVWFVIASGQGHKVAKAAATDIQPILSKLDLLGIAKTKTMDYYEHYIKNGSKTDLDLAGFIVDINGIPYTYAAAISPEYPIEASFLHPDGAITNIIMKHPGDEERSTSFDVDKSTRLTNHETHMNMGHISTSMFLAMDKKKQIRGKILISFIP